MQDTYTELLVSDIKSGDVLVHPTDSSKTWLVTNTDIEEFGLKTIITMEGDRWNMAADRLLPVLDHSECGECVDGLYHGAGFIENGVFKGFTGPCFRCGGKGYQDRDDRVRNTYYDNHVRRIYA